MPYCVQCGSTVRDSDRFCARCGAGQPGAQSNPIHDFAAGISGHTASLLCYIPVVGWIAGIFVLASRHFRHDPAVRFHGFQGLYLFLAWIIVQWAAAPFFPWPGYSAFALQQTLRGVADLLILAAQIFMLVKVSNGEDYHLPVLGDLATRSAERHS